MLRLILIVCLLVSACGYQFSGSGHLPQGVQRVGIRMFANRTAETGLEFQLTKDLMYEFTRSGVSLVEGSGKGEAVLSGTIVSVGEETVSRLQQTTSFERRITLTVDAKLTDADGKEIWFGKGISEQQTYQVSAKVSSGQVLSDLSQRERNKKKALTTVSGRIAEEIYRRLTIDF